MLLDCELSEVPFEVWTIPIPFHSAMVMIFEVVRLNTDSVHGRSAMGLWIVQALVRIFAYVWVNCSSTPLILFLKAETLSLAKSGY